MPKAKRRLYLAYGSNMNLEQMKYRCPTARVVGHAMLENWRLIFNGVASVERSKGDSVPVVVWDIQPKDEVALDVYEGWPRMYRKEIRRIKLGGKLVNAMIYIMNNVRYYSPPGSAYYNTIREGYESAGFDVNILREAAERAVSSTCVWCKNEWELSELFKTDIGLLCDQCIRAIRSRGETIWVEK